MHSSLKRMLTGAAFLTGTLFIAVMGYVMFGWSLLDAVYMVVITIFGIGYGEVQPLDTPVKKIFTMFVIIAGTSSAVYIIGGFIQMLTEGEINRALATRRNTRDINNLNQHVILCGFGRIGEVMVQKLAELGQPFVLIDNDPDRLSRAESFGYLICNGSAADEEVLHMAGIQRAKVLATVLPNDTMNVYITLTARSLNPKLIILSRGEFPATEQKLRLAGADHVVLPTNIGALQMANLIVRPPGLGFLDQTEDTHLNELLGQIDLQIAELAIAADSPLVGQTLSALEVRGKGAFVMVGLRKQDGSVMTQLNLNHILDAGDAVIVLGHQGDTPQFARTSQLRGVTQYRGARI
jgi:voltage-gated potassium channel